MDFIADLLKDNVYAFLALAMLRVMRTNRNNEREGSLLVFVSATLLVVVGGFDPLWTCVSVCSALFLMYEFLSADEWKVRRFNLIGKMIDFCFQFLFVRGGFFFLVASALFNRAGISTTHALVLKAISVGCYLGACSQCASSSFAMRPAGDIIDQLKKFHQIEKWEDLVREKDKFDIICEIEDKDFFERSEFSHRPHVSSKVKRLIKRLKARNNGIGARQLRASLNLRRGFSTIEWQLMRNVGLEFGSYRCTIRRKLFELIYSNLIINSYLRQFDKTSPKRENYRLWLMSCYLDYSPVKITGSSIYPSMNGTTERTFNRLFGHSFEVGIREEIFIWCLGLPHYRNGVGRRAIASHRWVIEKFGMSEELIYQVLENVRNGLE